MKFLVGVNFSYCYLCVNGIDFSYYYGFVHEWNGFFLLFISGGKSIYFLSNNKSVFSSSELFK